MLLHAWHRTNDPMDAALVLSRFNSIVFSGTRRSSALAFGIPAQRPAMTWKELSLLFVPHIFTLLGIMVWPFLLGCVMLIFRNPISGLIERISEGEIWGAKVKAPQPQPQQNPNSARDLVANPLGADTTTHSAQADSTLKQPAQHAPSSATSSGPTSATPPRPAFQSPQGSPLFEAVVERIKTAPEISGLKGEAREDLMARAFADKLIALSHERTYRLIYGSQIEAIARANVGNGISLEDLRRLFDAYKASQPEFHSHTMFEPWYMFIVESALIKAETNSDGSVVVRCTDAGREFLGYILANHLPYQKIG